MDTLRARVVAVHKNRWEIQADAPDVREAVLGPHCEPPVVGDWVTVSLGQGDTIARIVGIEARRSLLLRKRRPGSRRTPR